MTLHRWGHNRHGNNFIPFSREDKTLPTAREARKAFVYVLLCNGGSLYAGWTTDLALRLRAHARGAGAKYTRSRRPVMLYGFWPVEGRAAALREEARFRRLTRAAKLEELASRTRCPFVGQPEPARRRRTDVAMAKNAAPSKEEVESLGAEARTARARIHTAKGDIVFTFYPDDAPKHSAAFMKLARAGFYDGLTFHRVEPGFVIQGGCPEGSGTGGPGYHLDAEFNERPHVKGTVAMARASDPNSAGSQFYITLDDARFLDRQYTVFGQVVEGQEVVDAVRKGDVMEKVTIEA
jgi:cyclophilin family peptidyl-prolyl cis-trans isomerase/predicted GIY-YIG superfamily endonuclease